MSDMVERVALNLRLAGICHAHTHSVQIAQAAIAAMQAASQDSPSVPDVLTGGGYTWRRV